MSRFYAPTGNKYINQSINQSICTSPHVSARASARARACARATLISKIKDEVKIAVCNELKVVNSDRYTNKRAKECNCNTEIIERLNKHVDFLQKELLSKDAIINMLITDKCTTNVNSNNNEYKNKTELQNKQTLRKHAINPNTHRNNSDTHNNNSDIHNNNSDTQKYDFDTHKNNCDGTDFENVNSKKKSGNQRSISIIGDSILKKIDPYLMRKKLNNKTDKLYAHSFKGATVKHMNHHAQPVMGYNPNLVIIHAGTNSLRGNSTPDEVATEILELATSLKNETNEIVVSSIVPRRDHLNEKVGKVNDALTTKTSALGIGFISHKNINSNDHLKPKGLHLNNKGTIMLCDNFLKWINT